jgi:hypothetical protein
MGWRASATETASSYQKLWRARAEKRSAAASAVSATVNPRGDSPGSGAPGSSSSG